MAVVTKWLVIEFPTAVVVAVFGTTKRRQAEATSRIHPKHTTVLPWVGAESKVPKVGWELEGAGL